MVSQSFLNPLLSFPHPLCFLQQTTHIIQHNTQESNPARSLRLAKLHHHRSTLHSSSFPLPQLIILLLQSFPSLLRLSHLSLQRFVLIPQSQHVLRFALSQHAIHAQLLELPIRLRQLMNRPLLRRQFLLVILHRLRVELLQMLQLLLQHVRLHRQGPHRRLEGLVAVAAGREIHQLRDGGRCG